MATMLNGAAVMDAALLLIAANETRPQPQTSEHLAAVEMTKLENLTILKNKVHLIKEAQALEHQKNISAFIKGACSHFVDHALVETLDKVRWRSHRPSCRSLHSSNTTSTP